MKKIISHLMILIIACGSISPILAETVNNSGTQCSEENKGYVVQAYDKVADWTKDTTAKVADGTVNAYDSVANGTVKTYNNVADWTTNASDSIATGTVNIYNKAKDGTVNTFNKTKEELKKIF